MLDLTKFGPAPLASPGRGRAIAIAVATLASMVGGGRDDPGCSNDSTSCTVKASAAAASTVWEVFGQVADIPFLGGRASSVSSDYFIVDNNLYGVSGTVTEPGGQGVDGVRVNISGAESHSLTTMGPNGSYVQQVQHPGSYTVSISGGSPKVTECETGSVSGVSCTLDISDGGGEADFQVCPTAVVEQQMVADAVLLPAGDDTTPSCLDLEAEAGKATAGTDAPVAGISNWQPGKPSFLTDSTEPDQITLGSGSNTAVAKFGQTCLSGCINIAVLASEPGTGTAEKGVSVTGSLSPVDFGSEGSDYAVIPKDDAGYICSLGSAAVVADCGQSAAATTGNDGIAEFRYWLPGLVTTGALRSDVGGGLIPRVTSPNPEETIEFHTLCACGTKVAKVTLDLHSRLWVDNDATITSADILGLEALIAANKNKMAQVEKNYKDFLEFLKDAKILDEAVIDALEGVTDPDFEKAVATLMSIDPDSVMLSWFLNTFDIAGDGLISLNFDPNAVAKYLEAPLVNLATKYLADKAFEPAEKLPDSLKQLVDKAKDTVSDLINRFLTTAYDKFASDSWPQDVHKIMNDLVFNADHLAAKGKAPANARATIKLFDVTRCVQGLAARVSGQCVNAPLPTGFSYQLFLLFSEVSPPLANYFFPAPSNAPGENIDLSSETPIDYNPDYWIEAQCQLGCEQDNYP